MKKLTFSIFLMLMPLMASAETVEIDGINYNLTAKDKTAVVKSKSSGKYTGDGKFQAQRATSRNRD